MKFGIGRRHQEERSDFSLRPHYRFQVLRVNSQFHDLRNSPKVISVKISIYRWISIEVNCSLPIFVIHHLSGVKNYSTRFTKTAKMSSHHVVRDNQEPALVLYDVRYEDYPLVMNLMEWSPFVVLHENAFEEVKNWGIKIDLLVAEISTQEMETFFEVQRPFESIVGNLNNILERLQSKHHRMINFVGNFDLISSHTSDFELVCFENGFQYTHYDASFSKWLNKDETIEVIGSPPFVAKNLSEGKVFADGLVEIEASNRFWVKEKW